MRELCDIKRARAPLLRVETPPPVCAMFEHGIA